MKTRTNEEARIKAELDREIEHFNQVVGQMPCEQVAYLIIKRFMECENPPDYLRDSFHRWLVSPRNAQAKETALQRCFEEMF